MKTYPTYKESGYGWIGEIPNHWRIGKLKYFSEINPTKNSGTVTKDSEDLVTFLPMEKVNANGTYDTSLKRPIKELQSGFTYFELNDVIVAKITPCFENGKGALLSILDGEIGFGSTEFHVLRAIPEVSQPKFLYYITQSHMFKTTGEAFMYGAAGQKRVPTSHVTDFPLSCPPLPEQQAIADFLDCKTAQIDTLIEKKQRQIDLLQEQRTALINHAVTKGLNPNAPMKDSGVEWLGKIPEHWEVEELRRNWKVIDCKHKTATYVYDEGIPIVSTTEVKPGRLVLEKTRLTSRTDYLELIEGGRKPKRGDIIYSRNASLGSAAYVDTDQEFCMGQDVCLITSDSQNQLFLSYQLNSPVVSRQLESKMIGATFKRINISQILLFDVLRPPVAEQIAIAHYLDLMTRKIDNLIVVIEKQIELQKEYRTALISEAVTGKIDVREWKKAIHE